MKPYTTKAKKIVDIANRLAKTLQCNYVGTEHILAAFLKEGTSVAAEVLRSNGVAYEQLYKMIEELIAPETQVLVMEKSGYSPRAMQVLETAQSEAARYGCEQVGTEHLLIGLLKEGDCAAARLLNTLGCNMTKIFVELLGAMGEDPASHKEELAHSRAGAVARSNTPTLDMYSRDLTALVRDNQLDPVIGREKEPERMIQILCRRGKNNPCLIGDPGVGKTAIVE